MSNEVELAKNIGIREAGYNEKWLQDQICKNPAWLGLGEHVEVLNREVTLRGGRVDIMLKDSKNDIMYETEVMLGKTDEKHIIHTIEYWENGKRRWSDVDDHVAVLVAEKVTTRFFNVIRLLAKSVPMIAIQVSLNEVYGKQSLFFTTILNTYEEMDDVRTTRDTEECVIYNREWWENNHKEMLEAADGLRELLSSLTQQPMKFVPSKRVIIIDDENYQMRLRIAARKRLVLYFTRRGYKEDVLERMEKFLSWTDIRKNDIKKRWEIDITKSDVEQHKNDFIKLAELMADEDGWIEEE